MRRRRNRIAAFFGAVVTRLRRVLRLSTMTADEYATMTADDWNNLKG